MDCLDKLQNPESCVAIESHFSELTALLNERQLLHDNPDMEVGHCGMILAYLVMRSGAACGRGWKNILQRMIKSDIWSKYGDACLRRKIVLKFSKLLDAYSADQHDLETGVMTMNYNQESPNTFIDNQTEKEIQSTLTDQVARRAEAQSAWAEEFHTRVLFKQNPPRNQEIMIRLERLKDKHGINPEKQKHVVDKGTARAHTEEEGDCPLRAICKGEMFEEYEDAIRKKGYSTLEALVKAPLDETFGMPGDVHVSFTRVMAKWKEFVNENASGRAHAYGIFNMLHGVRTAKTQEEIQACRDKFQHNTPPDTTEGKRMDASQSETFSEVVKALGICDCVLSMSSLEHDEEKEERGRLHEEAKRAYFDTRGGTLEVCHTCNAWEINDSSIVLTPGKYDPHLFFCSPKCEGVFNSKRTGSGSGTNNAKKLTLEDVTCMSVKELKAAIKSMGLQSQLVGMTEKRELIDLVKENLGSWS
jgi:hypothetical protein